jgi:hypothetical protein
LRCARCGLPREMDERENFANFRLRVRPESPKHPAPFRALASYRALAAPDESR